MRVQVGNTLRVGLGDEVVIRGRLPADAKIGRLIVFASENGAQFSPYVPHVADVIVDDGRPAIMSPLAMRLMGAQAARQLTFTSDINGFVRVMQEFDRGETLAKVKLTRTINPDLSWMAKLQRKLTAWQSPKLSS